MPEVESNVSRVPIKIRLALFLTVLLSLSSAVSPALSSNSALSSTISNSGDEVTLAQNESTNWTAHLPVWDVGVRWTYDVVLDAQEMVAGSADLEGAELDLLTGTATMEVVGVEEISVGGEITPVYRTETIANVVGDGRDFPAPILGTVDGYLTAGFTLTEYLRVGDLALINYDKHIVMTFTAVVAFVEQTVDVADFVESGVYTPPLEYYDFPLAQNESWNLVTNLTKTYTGSSDVVTLPSEPEYFDQEWSFNINETGDGGFSGCANSTKVWQTNGEGEAEEWRWWCPTVNQYSRRWTTDIALGGIDADLQLTGFFPSTSSLSVTVELGRNSSPLHGEVDVWVNISDSDGNPLAEKSGYLYLRGVNRTTFVTDESGSAALRIAVGNKMDDTPTSDDWATHGVVAYLHSDQSVGATSLTIEGSAIGGLLRIHANSLASHASSAMANQSAFFEPSIRY